MSQIRVYHSDLSDDEFDRLRVSSTLAIDTETSGLDWRSNAIQTVQLYSGTDFVSIVRIDNEVPSKLLEIMRDETIQKVLHHAIFDLRLMCRMWRFYPSNIACTKVASKVLDPGRQDHSLKSLLDTHLGISLDKSQRLSDWSSMTLTEEQKLYAAEDVVHLVPLKEKLEEGLRRCDRFRLATRCWNHLPTRVELELNNIGDVYLY